MDDSGASSEPEIEEVHYDASANADNPKQSPIVREASRPRKRALELPSSPDESTLNRHAIQPTVSPHPLIDSWDHQCKYCGIKFSTGTALGGHSRVHRHQWSADSQTESHPFFPLVHSVRNFDLGMFYLFENTWQITAPPNLSQSPLAARPWVRCVLCGTELPNRSSLYSHFNEEHTYLKLESTPQKEPTEPSNENVKKKEADKSVKDEIEVIDLVSDDEDEEMVSVIT